MIVGASLTGGGAAATLRQANDVPGASGVRRYVASLILNHLALQLERTERGLLFYDQPVLVHGSYFHEAGHLRGVWSENEAVVVFEFPGTLGLYRAIGRTDPTLDQAAVGLQFERPSTAGRREFEGRRSEHHLLVRVFLVRMHPASSQNPFGVSLFHQPASAQIYDRARALRGPSKVAIIRATCWEVNIAMHASSE